MKATIFLIIAFTLILLPFLSCKKNNTSCNGVTEIVCTSINGSTFAGNTYTPGYTQYWQEGSYGSLNTTTGQLTIIAGNYSLQSWLLLNVLTPADSGATYSPAAGNLTVVYGIFNASNVIPTYNWKDSTSRGTLTITKLDTIANLMSGTFTGFTVDAEYGQTPATYSITGGTFTNVPIIQ